MVGVRFLNEHLQVGPNLLCNGFAVPIVEFTAEQATLQQQTHCVVEQLLEHVRIFTKNVYLLAIFAALEEDFGCILRGINAPEKVSFCRSAAGVGRL
jgi:hypothetical protein